MSVAPRMSGWSKWIGGPASSFGLSPSGGPTESPGVEIFIDGAWVNVASFGDVYYRDRVSVTRGRQDESSQVNASSAKFTLNNRDGKYSPRNPRSPYFGKIGRNTPCRIYVTQGDIRRYRFYGEISSWPQRWDISGTDVYVQVEAKGILQRLGQGVSPLQSPLRRQVPSQAHLKGYWPMEEGSGATRIDSPLSGVQDMIFTGLSLASDSTLGGSDALPTLGSSSSISMKVPSGSVGEWWVECVMKMPAQPVLETDILILAITGSADFSQIRFTQTTGNVWSSWTMDSSSGVETRRNFVNLGADHSGLWIRLQLYATTSGTDTVLRIRWTEIGSSVNDALNTHVDSVTFAGAPGRVSAVKSSFTGSGLSGTAIGHLGVFDALSFSAYDNADHGFNGEDPSTRMTRLSLEQDVPFTVTTKGTSGNTVTMGPQGIKTYLALMQEAAETDLGLLYEPRDQFGLAYRTRLSLYNQDATLALSYSDHELADSLNPVDDDQSTRNDVTISRSGGSSARAVLAEGPLSVLPPPDGVGTYDDSKTISIQTDEQLADQAGFRLHLGTVDESRYPQIVLNLRHSTFDDVTKLSGAYTMDCGDRLTIDDLPDWMPPEQISQLIQGYTETFDQFEYNMAVNCAPESPYQAAFLDSTVLGHVDTVGSETQADITDVQTTMSVGVSASYLADHNYSSTEPFLQWTTVAGDFPFDVMVDGEVMTVTNITGSGPQTFTVTRSVNGIVKSHSSGVDVRLATPSYISL